MIAADLDGNGTVDLAVTNAGADSASVLFGAGDGNFAEASTHATGSAPRALAASDLNRDGTLDLVVTNAGSNTVSVLLNDAGAADVPPTTPGAPGLAGESSPINHGSFTLTWAPSTDPENDAVTYALEHRDRDDAEFSEVATGLTAPSAPTTTPPGAGLAYDPVTDRYTYPWLTQRSWAGTCRQLVVTLADGTYHGANIRFTK